jgi:tetratricopeptide (TPR) repeat protein
LRAVAAVAVIAVVGCALWAIPRMDVKAMTTSAEDGSDAVGDRLNASSRSVRRLDPETSPAVPVSLPKPRIADTLAEKRRALEQAPTSAALRKDVAVYSLYAGDVAGAAREAEKALAIDPRLVTAYVPLAATAALTEPDTARAAYERMARIEPHGPSLASIGLADLALYGGQYDQAAGILELAITNDAHFGKGAALANTYLALAEARVGQGRPADAVTAVERALETSRHESVLLPAARLFLGLERERDALALARELHARATVQARAYAGIVTAEIAMRQGEAAAAIEGLREIVERTDLWLARFVLGTVYVQSARYGDAMGQFEMCGTRRVEATILFRDDVPTIRYLAALEHWMARARPGVTDLR